MIFRLLLNSTHKFATRISDNRKFNFRFVHSAWFWIILEMHRLVGETENGGNELTKKANFPLSFDFNKFPILSHSCNFVTWKLEKLFKNVKISMHWEKFLRFFFLLNNCIIFNRFSGVRKMIFHFHDLNFSRLKMLTKSKT